jgi:hypothetical protein
MWGFRARAFSYHLVGSLIWGVLALLLVFGMWYPSPLHVATGVTGIFLLIITVDVILGPLLTLIVFRPGKNRRALRFDLIVIITVQLLALAYGLVTVSQGRPVWIVFNIDRFDLVQAYELDNPYREQAQEHYQKLGWTGPQWVAARVPEEKSVRDELLFESLFAGVDLPQRPDLYVPYAEEQARIINKARSLDELKQYNSVADVEKVLKRYSEVSAYLPMMGRAESVTVLINKETAAVIAVVDLRPWQ